MSQTTITRIRAALVLIVLSLFIGADVFFYLKYKEAVNVINTQGQLLKFMVDTPEINMVLRQQAERLQGAPATTTKK